MSIFADKDHDGRTLDEAFTMASGLGGAAMMGAGTLLGAAGGVMMGGAGVGASLGVGAPLAVPVAGVGGLAMLAGGALGGAGAMLSGLSATGVAENAGDFTSDALGLSQVPGTDQFGNPIDR